MLHGHRLFQKTKTLKNMQSIYAIKNDSADLKDNILLVKTWVAVEGNMIS